MRSFAISLLLLPAALTAASSRPSRMQARGLKHFSPTRYEPEQKLFYDCPASQEGGAVLIGSQSRIFSKGYEFNKENYGVHPTRCEYAIAGQGDMTCVYDERGTLLRGGSDDGCAPKALPTTFAEAQADPENFTCKIKCADRISGRAWGMNALMTTSYDQGYIASQRTNWIECTYRDPIIGSPQHCLYKSESGDLIKDKSAEECEPTLLMANSYCLRLPQPQPA